MFLLAEATFLGWVLLLILVAGLVGGVVWFVRGLIQDNDVHEIRKHEDEQTREREADRR